MIWSKSAFGEDLCYLYNCTCTNWIWDPSNMRYLSQRGNIGKSCPEVCSLSMISSRKYYRRTGNNSNTVIEKYKKNDHFKRTPVNWTPKLHQYKPKGKRWQKCLTRSWKKKTLIHDGDHDLMCHSRFHIYLTSQYLMYIPCSNDSNVIPLVS
jgi:hypothetical protein